MSSQTKYKLIILLVLIFSSLLTSAYSKNHPSLANTGNKLWLSVTYPFNNSATFIKKSCSNILDSYFLLIDLKSKNVKLEERVKNLQADNVTLQEVKKENYRLKKTLKYKRKNKSKVKIVNVIAFNQSVSRNLIMLDYGSKDGAKIGQVIVDRNNLIGQIINISTNSSQVMLISDPLSKVDAINQKNRARGIVAGTLNKELSWKFVDKKERIKVGAVIISSGLDGIYPKGLIIGVVKRQSLSKDSLFKKITINPASNFLKLETVMVLISSGDKA